MANRIVGVHEGIDGIGIYAIMLPSSGFSVAHSNMSRGNCIRKVAPFKPPNYKTSIPQRYKVLQFSPWKLLHIV